MVIKISHVVSYEEFAEFFKLASKIFDDSYTRNIAEAWNDYQQENEASIYIAKDGDKIVGGLVASIIPVILDNPICYVTSVCVDPEYRKQHIGKQLMERVDQYAHKFHCMAAELSSANLVKRYPAHALYQSCGYDSNSEKHFIKEYNDDYYVY